MRLVVAVVGKPRNTAMAAVIHEYETRAARYWPLEVHEVREEKGGGLQPSEIRDREGSRLLERSGDGRLVACDPGGKSFSSEQFAAWLQREREAGRGTSILIGGAFGLSEQLLRGVTMRLSLAAWTLPHEVARLVLAEQLYRAGTIVRGEPYHK